MIASIINSYDTNKWYQSSDQGWQPSQNLKIPKFDGKMSFNIWKVQMMAILKQNKLKKTLDGKTKKP